MSELKDSNSFILKLMLIIIVKCMEASDSKWVGTLCSATSQTSTLTRVKCSKTSKLRTQNISKSVIMFPEMIFEVRQLLTSMVKHKLCIDRIATNNAHDPLFVHARKEK